NRNGSCRNASHVQHRRTIRNDHIHVFRDNFFDEHCNSSWIAICDTDHKLDLRGRTVAGHAQATHYCLDARRYRLFGARVDDPTLGTISGVCWARTESGQLTTTLQKAVRNSRRLIASPEARDEAWYRLKRQSLRDESMSALGQKQTCAAQNGMSALPPKATSNPTSSNSALGQKRT